MNFHVHTQDKPELIVGLEIGSSAIKLLVGTQSIQSGLQLLGVQQIKSLGMDKGGVNDLSLVRSTLHGAVESVSQHAGCTIGRVILALSGKHIGCQNEIGLIPLEEEEVTEEDVAHVLHIAQSVKLNEQHRLLHVIPQHYSIDYQDSIQNPVGLSGVRMAANVHLITYHHDTAKNLFKAVEQCGLQVEHSVFSGLASALSVLSQDEKELGVCSADIGAGTIDLCIYLGGELLHSEVIPYAGNVVTNDIAYAFGSPIAEAEQIKRSAGAALTSLVGATETVSISRIGGRPARTILRQELATVIEARYMELLRLLKASIRKAQASWNRSGQQALAAGIVFTGGGAEIEGFLSCAAQVLQCPVRKGKPSFLAPGSERALPSEFSTPLGLLLHEAQRPQRAYPKPTSWKSCLQLLSRAKEWIRSEF